MKQLIFSLSGVIMLLVSGEIIGQTYPQEIIEDSSPFPEEQNVQWYQERGEHVDFIKASTGNYLLVCKYYSKDVSQNRAETIQEKLSSAVAMNEQGKYYAYFESSFRLIRNNEPIDPFSPGSLVNSIVITFDKPIPDESGNAWFFVMTAEQGAKLLEKINSILE